MGGTNALLVYKAKITTRQGTYNSSKFKLEKQGTETTDGNAYRGSKSVDMKAIRML